MSVTADDVRDAGFNSVRLRAGGYDEEQVDAFLDRIVDTLNGKDHVTAADVHGAEFDTAPFGKPGYDEGEVDAFLRMVENTLAARVHESIRPSVPYVAPPLEHTHDRRSRWRRTQRR